MIYIKFKRVLDIIFSLILLMMLLLPGVLISLIVIFDIRDNPFFFQERVGKDTKVFKIYKFRTMREKYNEMGQLLSDEKRITRIGGLLRKLSIDELPQIVNILKGDMSFIGPRPLLVSYLSEYTKQQMQRHQLLPGLSGYAQVNGRNSISWTEKFNLDIYYVKNISFLLDLKILFLTLKRVIQQKDISERGYVTASKFVNDGSRGSK
ncbi:sugar transferase [Listeria fleischmannii]|uniref:sugar transferase n=1 Tax=Listeria fleischmannii TaxID=1069827 RepID=UPI000254F1D4|nr:sugar transferase [Listeria fleischmannii]EIA20383.1 general glycosylation pathway protein [Listeria fleischmannii subsp. coloradonensis]STY33721.1 Putative colanic biosynthesis UDP-glucose lipid carrier transferase [Listeria fleischmannii subsp. coloradonensis]